MTFPDAPKVLAYLLAPLAGGMGRAGTETPADLQQRLPYIRVGRTGGSDDGVTDFPTLEVDFFAATRDAAVAGSEQVRELLTRTPYHVVEVAGSEVLIDSVTTLVGPRELVWLGTGVRRFTGTYRAEFRHH